MARKNPAAGNTKDTEIFVSLKNLMNAWGILETPLINCEMYLTLTWSANSVITDSTDAETFAITNKNTVSSSSYPVDSQ